MGIPMALFRALKLTAKPLNVRQRKLSEMLTELRANLSMIILATITSWLFNNIESITIHYSNYSCPSYCSVEHKHIELKSELNTGGNL